MLVFSCSNFFILWHVQSTYMIDDTDDAFSILEIPDNKTTTKTKTKTIKEKAVKPSVSVRVRVYA